MGPPSPLVRPKYSPNACTALQQWGPTNHLHTQAGRASNGSNAQISQRTHNGGNFFCGRGI